MIDQRLFKETELDIRLSFRKTSILRRFLFLQMVGALFSLALCPQFGLGLIPGHGVTHVIRLVGEWACASFCGAIFLSVGSLLCLISMKPVELWWIWRRYKYSLIFLPPFLWGLLMLTNWQVRFSSEVPAFHGIWLLSGVATLLLWQFLVFKNLKVDEL